jgi:hypothetical protein
MSTPYFVMPNDDKLHIKRRPFHLSEHGIQTVCQKYNAVFMGYWCTKRPSGGWNEVPVDVFYVAEPDRSKGHTNYFGMYVDNEDRVMITDASSCFSEDIYGMVCHNEVHVSRYRHHFVETDCGFIDGGRDYIKRSGITRLVKVIVNGSNFEFEEVNNES